MYRSKFLVMILLATLTLDLMVPTVSRITLIQQAKAVTSGQPMNSPAIINEEISPPVKSFILNQIVNKSKAAIVVGFVDPNGIRIFSFGNMSSVWKL
jgi:hypothetical protein